MVLVPEVQKNAQRELDAVLQGALPTLADQGRLPYTMALVKEVFRWHPVTTLGECYLPCMIYLLIIGYQLSPTR